MLLQDVNNNLQLPFIWSIFTQYWDTSWQVLWTQLISSVLSMSCFIQIHSVQLQKTLGRSLLQAGLITTFLPLIIKFLGFEILYWILMGLSLIFTYGYLTFYNMDVTEQTMNIMLWRFQNDRQGMIQLDVIERQGGLRRISSEIQSFIFQMVYYTPMNAIIILITFFDQTFSPWVLVITDCFFNSCFYYFRKWPYDKYNVAYLERHLPYCMGYGLFVSLVTNILLPSTMSIGGFLLISQIMIINAICHSPIEVEFHSFKEILNVVSNRSVRMGLANAYNNHRRQLRDRNYRQKLMSDCFFMKSYFIFTKRMNNWLAGYLYPQIPIVPVTAAWNVDNSEITELNEGRAEPIKNNEKPE